MAKKVCWAIIFITIAINVVMLQWTIEAYLGLEFDKIFIYSPIAVGSSIIALITFFRWKKLEYSDDK
ncbi:hypothetical protein [Bacillus alkalicellulosilyticus]|uniref:hypothetical protein n=1 Tax=Alkalihalobacterium alkalicellulosilyticum TaxID=1912214 RepID=UPI0009971517|nr:hypothetical protein [Bacillus alkalicellulosilyticus]